MTEYLFVDGNCLRVHVNKFAERYAPGVDLRINWNQLKGRYEKVFYYDAIPVRLEDESEGAHEERIAKIGALHASISEVDGYRVYEGDARKRSGKGLEQKKVDVMIAVDMLTHTIRRNMLRAGLLAGDLDFKPLLDALVSEGMFVTLIHPPKFTSKELQRAADARQPLSARDTYNLLDRESRETVGIIPTPSMANAPQIQTCQKIMDVEGGPTDLSIWHDMAEHTVTVLWRQDRDVFMHLRNANWENTRKFAMDDYGIDLPEALPKEFSML